MRALTQDAIDDIFAVAKSQAEYVVGLYRLALPGFDETKQVESYPKVSRTTNLHIFDRAMTWDNAHQNWEHPFMAGGAWMNWGFSVGENIPDWTVEE